jgi:hypothetical protein
MAAQRKQILFGNSGVVTVLFDTVDGGDTGVRLESDGVADDSTLFWISDKDKQSFCDELQELIQKYYI